MTTSSRRVLFALALSFSLPIPSRIWAAPAPVAPAKTIRAVVRDDKGAPVADASVVVVLRNEDKEETRELATDAQGRFETQPLKPQQGAEIFVYAPGFALQHANFQDGADQEITLRPGVSATGKVVDEKGKPVANAAVSVDFLVLSANDEDDEDDEEARWISLHSLSEKLPLKRAMRTQSGADGVWKIDDLPAGARVTVDLLDPRFAHEVTEVTLGQSGGQAPDTIVKPGATLKGRVLDSNGKPLENAHIQVHVGEGGGSYASAQSAPDGTYTLTSLHAGAAGITVAPPNANLAPASLKGVLTKAGATVSAPDIELGAGVLLTGKVLDKETKAPLAGARVMAQGDFDGVASNETGADGSYSVRVPTGLARFYIFSPPSGYLRSDFMDASVSVGAASTKAPDFALQRGLDLSGTAFDENGAPAVAAVISAGDSWDGAQTKVDAQGNWSLSGVDPSPNGRTMPKNQVRLQTAGDWQIVGDGLVSTHAGDKIALKLRLIERQDVTLRVVTPAGEPIAGAQVRIATLFDAQAGATRFDQAVSNARGEVTVKKLRPEESVEITPTKEGYALQKAGVISVLAGDKTRATDAIMTPKNGILRGRIVDSDGVAASGASVAVLWPGDLRDAKSLVQSDADGKFELDDLRAGEVLIGAACGRDFGQITAQTGGDVEIKLASATPQPAPQNRELARETLAQWFADGKQGRNSNLAEYAASLAALDAATAPQLAAIVGAQNKPFFESALANQLAKSDPARAIAAARAKVEAAPNPEARDGDLLDLASLLLKNGDADGARAAYELAAPGAKSAAKIIAPDGNATSPYRYAQLAGIAGALRHPDADYWIELLDRSLPAKPDDEMMFRVGGYMEAFAENDVDGALSFLETLAPVAQIRAYEDVIPLVAKRDLPRAQQLLKRMETLVARTDLPIQPERNDAMYRPTPARSLNVARAAIVRELLPTDPRAAYQQSTQLTADGYELERLQIDTALRLPKNEALPILRAQFALAQTNGNRDGSALARLAKLVAPFDAQLSEQWFETAREKLKSNRDLGDESREMAAPYAFYRADSDAAQSRLLLENEWQRLLNTETNADYMDSKIYRFQNAAWAMVPIDWPRALEMMREKDEVLGDQQYNQVLTQRNFLTWLLASAPERHEMNFERPSIGLFG